MTPVVDGQTRQRPAPMPELALRGHIPRTPLTQPPPIPVGEVVELPPEAMRLFEPAWQDTVSPGEVD